MKATMKTFAIAIAMLSLTVAKAQNTADSTENASPLSKLSITPSFGFINSWSDLSNSGRFSEFAKPSQNKLGYGLRINYDLLKFLRVSGGMIAGSAWDSHETIHSTGAINEPKDLGQGIFYETKTFEVVFPRIDINLSQLIFNNRSEFFNHFAVNLHGSHGLLFFDSKIYALEDPNVHLLYGKHRGRSGKTTEAISSVGLDFAYKISDQLDINLATSLRNVWNDRLDAWESPGSANDKLTYTSLGLTIYLNKRSASSVSKKTEKKKQPKEEKQKDDTNTKKSDDESSTVDSETNKKPDEDSTFAVFKNPVVDDVVKKDTAVTKTPTPSTEDEATEGPEESAEPEVKDTEEPLAPANPDEVYEGNGNFVVVSAFRTQKQAFVSAEGFRKKGENPMVVFDQNRNYYFVAIDRYDDLTVALSKMREARKKGYKLAWVFIKN